METKFTVGILGATALTGKELLKIVLGHPRLTTSWLHSNTSAGLEYGDIYPQFKGRIPQGALILKSLEEVKGSKPDILFSCLPHGFSAEILWEFYENNHTSIVDLSADFRLANEQTYQKYYGKPHPRPDLLKVATYGLSELNQGKLKGCRLVGNPGCYPTSILLPTIPLLKRGLIDTQAIISDSKSGVSGAGKGLSEATHFVNSNESIKAYQPGDQHRHLSEINEQLSDASNRPTEILFTPHLVPMERGILSTLYTQLTPGTDFERVRGELTSFYQDSPFVKIVSSLPSTLDVKGTNRCHIYPYVPTGTTSLILISVLDNLIKGAAGQAVQNMNLILGFPEEMGLAYL